MNETIEQEQVDLSGDQYPEGYGAPAAEAPDPYAERFQKYDYGINDLTHRYRSLEDQFRNFANRPSQPSIDMKQLEALAAYDPRLHEILSESLPKAIQHQPIDPSMFQPYAESIAYHNNRALVESHFDVEYLDSIVPPVEGNKFAPKTEAQALFVEWYTTQPDNIKNDLTALGPRYIKAIKKFESWQGQRVSKAQNNTQKLAKGAAPRAGGNTEHNTDDPFLAGFYEARKAMEE